MPAQGASDDAADVLKVGYVGVGTMGGALARRLILSRPVMVYDTRPDIAAAFAAEGTRVGASAADVARECDVIFVCVPTSAIVRQVALGPGGLLEGLSPGKIVVDQTTGNPSETRAIAAALAEAGVAMVDAPVSGGTRGAVAGTIGIFCGGPLDAFEQVRPILDQISPNVVRCGDVGAGHAAKLVQNATAACNRLVTLECAAAACLMGVSLAEMEAPIVKGAAWNGGAERIIPSLATDRPTSDFQMGLMVKDLRLAMDIGNEVGAPMLVANTVRAVFQMCANERGAGRNLDDIAHLVEQMAGVTFTEHGQAR